MRLNLPRVIGTVGLLAVLLSVPATAASAAIAESTAPATSGVTEVDTNMTVSLAASTKTTTVTDANCVTAAKAAQLTVGTSDCAETIGLTVTAAKHPTVAQMQSIGIDAASASTIWYRDWSEYTLGATWKEVHDGEEYWSGYHVWERHLFDGYEGWHRCDVGGSYGFGFAIDVTQCYTQPTLSTSRIQSYDVFKVSVAFHGFPISYTHSMHTNMYPSGTITYH